MATIGRFGNFLWGYSDLVEMACKSQPDVFSMAADAAGYCARFMARGTRDIKSVYFNWSSAVTPGTVNLRIETIDATTGKPTGTLYDANASKSFTPSTGWQNVAFDVTPTTGLTSGTAYGIVLVKSGAGTTVDLTAAVSRSIESQFPATVLTTATAGTSSSYAERNAGVLPAVPVLSVVFEDDAEEALGFCPFHQTQDRSCFGTNSHGAKITTIGSLTVIGIRFGFITRSGTPSDMIARIWDSANSQVVSGCEVTIDKDYLLNTTSRRVVAYFPAPVTLPAGTYYVMMQQSDAGSTSTNYYRIRSCQARSVTTVPAGCHYVSSTNITTVPPTFTPTTSEQPNVSLIYDELTFSGGGGIMSYGGGMEGM